MQTNPFTEINDKLDYLVTLICRNQENQPTSTNTDDSLLSLNEAEQLLHMPASTIHFHKKHNKLPFLKPGKRLLFEKEKLLDWLKNFNSENIPQALPLDKMRRERQRYSK